VIGPGMVDWDFSLVKDTRLPHTETAKLEFRAEFFNILNKTNLQFPSPYGLTTNTNSDFIFSGANIPELNPGGAELNAAAGQVSNTSTNSRQIQFAVKFIF